MSRLSRAFGWLVIGIVTLLPGAWALDQESEILLESRIDWLDAAQSWTDGGSGKFRGGDGSGGKDMTAALRLAVDHKLWLSETLSTNVTLDGYLGNDSWFGLTEGWVAWRPIPRSAWQHHVRAGLFIPPFSLEHTGTAWTSYWMPSSSVLNGWLGEEVNVTGVEYTLRYNGALAGREDSWTLRAAAFYNNDTSGTILSWRGWVSTDRVTPYGRSLPLPDRAAFRPGGTFAGVSRTDPFIDTDQRPGYYLAGEWRRHRYLRVLAAHYDNRADPLSFANDQAGWRTRFSVIGLHFEPSADFDLIAQLGSGNTVVGRLGTPFSADNDFLAWYALGRKRFDRHQVALRYESFRVTDEDLNRVDDNREEGNVWAIAWQFEPSKNYTVGLEAMRIESWRPDRELLDASSEHTERRLRLLLRAEF